MTDDTGFDWIALQRQAHREFGGRLAAVTDWDAPTPDTEWSVRDLVRHVVEEQQWVPQLLAGRSTSQAASEIGALGDDLRAEWRLHSLAASAAWAAADHSATVRLSYDVVTMPHYLREQTSDVAIHAWDLARATGADEHLDDDLVAAVWSVFEPQEETLAASGLYASPVPLPDDAPLEWRLLAVTGRDPRSV
ncbi:MAG: hypothetical protein RI885_2109 [Actinomycetota bacterium]